MEYMHEKYSSPSDDHPELLPVRHEAESTAEGHQRDLQLEETRQPIHEIVAVARTQVHEVPRGGGRGGVGDVEVRYASAGLGLGAYGLTTSLRR